MNKGIQGFKGLLSIFILLFHYTYRYPQIYGHEIISWSFEYGSVIGVTLFFVLSGYYFQKSINKHRNFTTFAISKLTRLYPPLILSLLITLVFKGFDTGDGGAIHRLR